MITGLKPYSWTKDSGVLWLGTAPAHWERRRLKSLLRTIDRRSSTGTETLLSLRRDHGIVVYSQHFSRPAQGATTVGYKIVNKGQLVVNRLQANNGLVFDSPLDGLVSPDYSVFESRNQVSMPYLSLLLRTTTYRHHFDASRPDSEPAVPGS
jgi:type I restriction enzyme S subunit